MRLQAAISGDLRKIVEQELRSAQAAVVSGLREAGKGLRDELKAHTADADLGGLGRAWTVRVYRGRSALSAAALIYPKGRAAREALWAFEHGATIRPVNGRYLAIPTQFNRRRGRRGGRVIYRPEELQDTFVARGPGGDLLLFARLQHAQRKVNGSVRDLAAVNSHVLGSGRKKRTAKLLGYGVVPMFILKPQVRLSKRLDVAGIARKWESRTADIILKRWKRAGGGDGG